MKEVTGRGRGDLNNSRNRKARIFGVLLASAAAAGAPGIAQAQTSPAPAEAQSTSGVQDIVVTASKRSEAISKAPLAVTALSQDQLRTAGVTGLKDLTTSVPNIEIKTVSFANSIQVTIRGITNSDFNQGGDPAVATYVDGIYVAHTQGLQGGLYDLARVEVLRGPQGTLYGRNSTGGNLNIVTAQPENKFDASADVSYGSFNDVQAHAMINLPLSDTLAIRAAVMTHQSDGFFRTNGTTTRDYNKADDLGGRLTMLWTPSSSFSWRLSVDHFRSRGTPGLDLDTAPDGSPADGGSVYNRYVNTYPEPLNSIDNFMVRSRMEWRWTDNLQLVYIAGYQHVRTQQVFDGDGTTAQILDGQRNATIKGISNEVNLSYESRRLKNILGGTYLYGRVGDHDNYDFYNANLGAGFNDIVRNRSWGIFDQATFSLTDALRVIGGIRYSHDSKSDRGDHQTFCLPGTPFESLSHEIVGPGCSFSVVPSTSGQWSSVNWRAGLEYDLSPHTLTYATVTTGFKAGGINEGTTLFKTYQPETVTNYELGLKTKFLDNRASVNAALFYEKYNNLQVSQIVFVSGVTSATVTKNAGEAAIYGLELEGQLLLSDNDKISAFGNYLHATYTSYHGAIDQQTGNVYASLDGNQLPNAPKFSGRFQYSHDFELSSGAKITPSASVYWQSRAFLREFNLTVDRVPSYTRTDLNLTYTSSDDRWMAQAFVTNLENKAVRNGAVTVIGHYYSDYFPPRQAGVRLSFKY